MPVNNKDQKQQQKYISKIDYHQLDFICSLIFSRPAYYLIKITHSLKNKCTCILSAFSRSSVCMRVKKQIPNS
jgi:hypothetical protein